MTFILMMLMILAACAVLLTVAPLRKRLLTAPILKGFRAAARKPFRIGAVSSRFLSGATVSNTAQAARIISIIRMNVMAFSSRVGQLIWEGVHAGRR